MRKPVDDVLAVASVPAAHPYVTGLGLAGVGVRVLDDPPVPGAPPGRWWPPRMLDPSWVAAHHRTFDLMHVHFGVESLSLPRLSSVLDALNRHDKPLVYTVHDLSHPQLVDQGHHRAQLALLVDRAAALITLTSGAADELERRFSARADVIPHPAMRSADRPPRVAEPGAAVIGVHLRDLRPGIDGPGTVRALSAALVALPGVTGRVYLNADVRDAAAGAAVAASCAASPALELRRRPRPDDAGLEAELCALAVSLLPYRHGTHSGWLELCFDLGVPVAAPAIGHLADQHREPGVTVGFAPGHVTGLIEGLREALAWPHATAGSPARRQMAHARAGERARASPAIAGAHADIYRAVLRARR